MEFLLGLINLIDGWVILEGIYESPMTAIFEGRWAKSYICGSCKHTAVEPEKFKVTFITHMRL